MTEKRRGLARVRRLVTDLTGRSGGKIVAHVLAQIDIAVEGVELAGSMARRELPTDEARSEMSQIEHRGDEQRVQLVHGLSGALATPIDREDLYRLSRSVDDVLDNLRDFVRESDLYQPGELAPMVEPLQAVADGLRCLRVAVTQILASPADVHTHAMEARKHGNQVRVLYQARLGELFNGREVTMEVFKTRELLRRLDVVALRLSEAADALNDGMLKRSL
jgi:uncharacterized protein Yka (UPF0111/DUF47 family)